ncbi:unnamed protein product [Prunus armeniaca]
MLLPHSEPGQTDLEPIGLTQGTIIPLPSGMGLHMPFSRLPTNTGLLTASIELGWGSTHSLTLPAQPTNMLAFLC